MRRLMSRQRSSSVGPRASFSSSSVRQHVEHVLRAQQQPDRHHVRVGVVVNTGLGGPRVSGAVLVGSHHAADAKPIEGRVVAGEAGEEAGDLQDRLRAVVGAELQIVGGLVVLPDVVGHGQTDVALQVAGVGQPAPGHRVEVHPLALLASVAARLPGVHRAGEPGRPRRPPGRVQPPGAVAQQGPGQSRQPQREDRQHEQLVPEDVAPVGLAVQAAGRQTGVEVDVVWGDRLQQVEHRQPQRAERVDGRGAVPGAQLQPEPAPQLVPGQLVALQQLIERGCAGEQLGRRRPRLRDADVTGRDHGNDLLHRNRFTRPHRQLELVGDAARLPPAPARNLVALVTTHHHRPCRLGDAQLGLRGPGHQQHRRRLGLGALHDVEMGGRHAGVAGHARVGDGAVDTGLDQQPPAPVLRREHGVQPGQLPACHMHEPALPDRCGAPGAVGEPQRADQQPAPHVQLDPLTNLRPVRQIEPGRILATVVEHREPQNQPVRQVDQALRFDHLIGELVTQPVVAAGRVGAGIAHAVGHRLRGGAPSGEAAVAERAQGLPPTLVGGIPPVEHERPRVGSVHATDVRPEAPDDGTVQRPHLRDHRPCPRTPDAGQPGPRTSLERRHTMHRSQQLITAVEHALRAPSVHNTQPWRWRITENTIELHADWNRHLVATDPDRRDLVLSCGAALHHLLVGLAAQDLPVRVERMPDPENTGHLATVTVDATATAAGHVVDGRLLRFIGRRRTDRRRMSHRPVPDQLMSTLTRQAERAGAHLLPVTGEAMRERLNGALLAGAHRQEFSAGYATELELWTRRYAAARDGIPTTSITHVATSSAGSTARRRFPHGQLRQPQQRTGQDTGDAALLVVVATTDDAMIDRLRAGEATSAVLLEATRRGLATTPLSQGVEIDATRRAIQQDVLRVPEHPQLLIRVGWPASNAAEIPQTPRRDLRSVLLSN